MVSTKLCPVDFLWRKQPEKLHGIEAKLCTSESLSQQHESVKTAGGLEVYCLNGEKETALK